MLSNWDHDRNAEHRLFQEDITLCSNKPIPPAVPAVLARHRWVAVPNVHTQHQRGGPDCSRSAACRCNPFATHCSNLVQEWDSGKNKAAPVRTFLNQMRLCGGRLQAEAADSKELINNFETG